MDQKKMAEILKEYRHKKGWSQVDISKRLGISRSVFSFLENGNQNFNQKHLTVIKERLDLDLVELANPDHDTVREGRPYYGPPLEMPKDVAAIAGMINDAREVKKDLQIVMNLIDRIKQDDEGPLTANQVKLVNSIKEIVSRCQIIL